MVRKFIGIVAVVAVTAIAAQPAAAQGFQPGYTDIGPVIGLGSVGDASIAFGGRFEKGIKPLESLGGGILGIQVGAQYYSWDGNSSFGGWKTTIIPIGVTANYHFKTSDTKIDPFLGLGLGFQIVNCDADFLGFDPCDDSALYFIGRAGIRYFTTESLALYADVGAGGATLNAGVMFRLK